ncbi:MAG: hypothetical protein R2939_14095 [Kofleriaceae bacterium]
MLEARGDGPSAAPPAPGWFGSDLREQLADPAGAVAGYREATLRAPGHAGARAALLRLVRAGARPRW